MEAIAETLRIEIPIETIDRTEPGLSRMAAGFRNLDAAARQAQQSTRQAGSQGSQFERTAQRTQRSTQSWMRQKFQAVLEAKDRVTPVVKSAMAIVKSLAGKTWKVTLKALDMATAPIKKVFSMLKSPLMAAGITLSAGAGVADTVKTFAGFEAGMSQVKAISGASGEDFDKLTAKAKQMGATTKFTATESAEAFNYMAMAGWKTEDMMGGIEGIMNLAAASGESLGTTSDIVTDALTAFGMKANEAGHFSDVLAQASSNSNTNVGLMGETFKYVGSMAGSLGYSVEDMALATGLMANTGLKGSMAGTSLNSIMTRLATNTRGATDAIKAIGVEFYNSDGSARDFSDVMGELRTATANMTDEQKSNLAKTVAGVEAQKGLLAILNASTEDYDKLTEAVNNADGASEKMSKTMMDNLAGSFTYFLSALDGVKISLGEKFSPYLRGMLDWLTAQMPNFEDKLLRAFDSIEEKMKSLKEKIKEFTGTDEWKNADFFGKVEIAWDELIAQPFTEWWNSKGKGMMSMMARSIGEGAGSTLRFGFLALLGFDISGVAEEGASVGKSFVAGFTEGLDFDSIKGKLWDGIGNLFSSAGKLLPGGEGADFGSLLSAALLARVANPLLALGGRGVSLGRTVAGAGGTILGSAAAGTGLRGLGASAGMIGLKLGSNATGAGLVASGAGAVAGGVIGGATLISGVLDLYKGFKSKDKEEASAYKESGAWTVGGVAAGATIGSVLGPIGALVGAGIGGIAGWLKGNDVKKEYEEKKKAAEEAAAAEELMNQKAKYASKNARFETEALNEAFKDTTLSAEEFGAMVQEAAGESLKSHFGDIKLSLKEIEEAGKNIVFADQEKVFTTFSDATGQAESSLEALQGSLSNVEKLNWKASLGIEFSETEVESYKAGIDSMMQNASKYLEDKHYEANAAITLLLNGQGTPVDMTSGLNSMYASYQEQLNSLGGELNAKVDIALEDGVISVDEQAEISNLQNQITAITDQITQADTEATFQMMKVKYNGAALDADSFAGLQTEIQSQVETLSQGYDDAYQVAVSNLNLQLASGAINQDQFTTQLDVLTNGYEAKIKDLAIRVESFQMESIADAYSSELEGILPNIEGTTAEKLSQGLHNAMAAGVDVINWDTETASKWLGLDGLDGETIAAVTARVSDVAKTIPEALKNSMSSSMSEVMAAMDFAPVMADVGAKIGEAMTGIDFTPLSSSFGTMLSGALTQVDYSEVSTGLASIADTELSTSFTSVGQQAGTPVPGNISNSIAANASSVQPGCQAVRNAANGYMANAFANPFNVSATVNISAKYNVLNPFKPGSIGFPARANGGFVNGAELSWIGEDGPEAVIPLGAKRRSRGLALWQKAGELLGVGKHAEGGIINPSNLPITAMGTDVKRMNDAASSLNGSRKPLEIPLEKVTEQKETVGVEGTSVDRENTPQKTEVNVSVNVNPKFEVPASQNTDDVLRVIRGHMREIADELGGEIAERLGEVFSNMPIKAV